MQYMWLLIFGVIFIVLSIFDIRTGHIPVVWFGVVAVLSVLCFCITGDDDAGMIDVILSCIPGAVLIAMTYLTEGKIGLGDGLLILCLGPGLGLERIAYVLMGALVAGSIYSGVLLIFRRAGRNTSFPFVPFITIGLGVMGCVCTLM